MGTKMAPTYATLVMGFLERKLYDKFQQKYGDDEKEKFEKSLDDCFLLWRKSHNELQEFHALLNSLHTKIQFTMENSENKLPFLDVLVCKSGKGLHTDIFYKQTDTHQYLNFQSCHPKSTKLNIYLTH